jgi:uncharacterized repeat protein (TIGR01451 family)
MGRSLKNAAAGALSRRFQAVLGAVVVLGFSVGTAAATHLQIDTEGHTTLEQILTGTGPRSDPSYSTLDISQVNDEYIVRDPAGVAQPGRATRRRSLAYFSQLTDFQLADEESPARVEFSDQGPSSAWRPMEAFHPFVIDASIRQVNRFAGASPVPQGGGTGNAMDFALLTGDQADNQQLNEMIWTRELIEGGTPLNFNSGLTDPNAYSLQNLPDLVCQAFVTQKGGQAAAAAEGARYTGVQDYDDYDEGLNPYFYDPDDPRGFWADRGWPTYTGLMDRAQMLSITPAGLDVPSYWVNGNHDVLVQGNEDANRAFEDVATGCQKTLASTQSTSPPSEPDPDFINPNPLLDPSASMLVPPDPLRQFVDKAQIKQVIGATATDNGHGFDFVDDAEELDSNGAADYYAWDPPQTPGVRFIAIGTNSEGGIVGPFGPMPTGSSNGNLDDPQFQWLEDQLTAAQAAGELIVLFGHHPVRTMDADVPDEAASHCTEPDAHGHDVNPGCDLDPRISEPLHFGTPEQAAQFGSTAETFTELVGRFPNVIGYVAGHTHEHKLIPFTRSDSSVWWEINTSATADWPQQHRLIDVMDNRDGTLSIFGTVLDHASPATAPAPGDASGFGNSQLASIGRTFSFADPQSGPPSGEGTPEDRNVEMLLADPRRADLSLTKSDRPDPVKAGARLTYTIRVTNNGPSTATAPVVTDTLPSTGIFISASASSGSCQRAGSQVTCALGDLARGASATVTIVINAGTKRGTITNTASVTAAQVDPQPANNSDTESTTVKPGAGN